MCNLKKYNIVNKKTDHMAYTVKQHFPLSKTCSSYNLMSTMLLKQLYTQYANKVEQSRLMRFYSHSGVVISHCLWNKCLEEYT